MRTAWWSAVLALVFAAVVLAAAFAHGNKSAGVGAVGAFLIVGCLVMDRYITGGEQ